MGVALVTIEERRELLLKKKQGNGAVLAFLFAVNNRLTNCTLPTRRSVSVLKVGVTPVGVSKLIKEGWPMVLW